MSKTALEAFITEIKAWCDWADGQNKIKTKGFDKSLGLYASTEKEMIEELKVKIKSTFKQY